MTTRVTVRTLADWPLPGPESSEKNSRGVALVVGGGAETPGAARLAAEAAMRAGCGKSRIATVDAVAHQLAVAVPEARVFGFRQTEAGNLSAQDASSVADLAGGADATLVGSGFTDPREADAFCAALLPSVQGPVVLDALGTAYAGSHRGLGDVSGPVVLTVNPSELAHVLGVEATEVDDDPEGAVRRLVDESGAVVLLGGSTKYAGGPSGDRLFAVETGGPGLATAGSGDVQAGLVTGLLARGAEPLQACVWAAWLHGTAGERLARAGSLGFLARELAAHVPALLDEVGQPER